MQFGKAKSKAMGISIAEQIEMVTKQRSNSPDGIQGKKKSLMREDKEYLMRGIQKHLEKHAIISFHFYMNILKPRHILKSPVHNKSI